MSNREGFIVRPLRAEDIPAAQAVMFRSVKEDFGSEYDAEIHADIDGIDTWYLNPEEPGPFMLVAEDTETGEVIATGGARNGRLKAGVTPPELVERYSDGKSGQIVRVYVLREQRRRGIAQALFEAILDRIAADGVYEAVNLHTFRPSPGAVPFWTAMGAEILVDDTNGASTALYMEIPGSVLDTRRSRLQPQSA
jgi:GNAT superfamily N-acetyltransferase